MEQIIAKLLEEFERGKMNRRQLIQSLTMAASVAGAAAPASATEGKGFQAVTVNHISYQVADYAKTRDFYADLLGMKVSHDDGKQCYMSFGNTFLLPRNARQGVTAPRVDHVAYTIETWDKNAVEAELKRRGLSPRPDTEDSFHVKDPDGFDLQISGKNMKP
ncbi:MAG TPA: VOC family protein [Candidatus Acidoferrales bacterium]|jgi:catechol 2,3-dioxygenase-like lactoylglutathione lyase family enzyme|nr:VOC family protein [Candidatus Acidoferrales bacterium]